MNVRNLSRKEQLFLSAIIFIGVAALIFAMLKVSGCSNIIEQEVYISEGTEYIQISAGLAHTCLLDIDGNIECIGCQSPDLDFGQCGPFEDTYVQVSAGGAHTCAIRLDGRVECRGCVGSLLNLIDINSGQCDVLNIAAKSISAGLFHTEVITMMGDSVCWGDCPNDAYESYDVYYETYEEQPLQLVEDDYEQQSLVEEQIYNDHYLCI
ncbi:MAG: hypothetical protein KKB31_05835 [Nanoarchaeota archaeon]|nr:hypothetical protein [Nanoarchaeota archaeon]